MDAEKWAKAVQVIRWCMVPDGPEEVIERQILVNALAFADPSDRAERQLRHAEDEVDYAINREVMARLADGAQRIVRLTKFEPVFEEGDVTPELRDRFKTPYYMQEVYRKRAYLQPVRKQHVTAEGKPIEVFMEREQAREL